MNAGPERSLVIADPAQRRDLAVFTERALRLDPAAVIRLRTRADGLLGAWVATGLDVLACRAVNAALRPADVTAGADQLHHGLLEPGPAVDLGMPMDSAWRGALPPETGFAHIDDVPAAVIIELAQRGADLARDHGGPMGPPVSLLDQEVLTVSDGAESAAIPMRCVLALTAMAFLPQPAEPAEVVRIRATPSWLRVDARFGSVFRRRGAPAGLT